MSASLGVALSAIVWGCWWIPLRELSERGLPTDWTSLAVYGVGALAMAPFAVRRPTRFGDAGLTLLGVALFVGTALAAWNHALITGDVVRVTLLFYLAPVWGTALGILALGVPFSPVRALSILSGLTGAGVVLGFEGGLPVPRGEGEWMGLAAGLLFALGATCAHKMRASVECEKTFLTFICAAIAAGVLIVVQPGGTTLPTASVAGVAPLVVGTAIFILLPITWLLLWGAGKLDPGRVSILLLLEVVAASVTATALTDEPFGWREAGGAALIVVAGALEAFVDFTNRRPMSRGPGRSQP